MNVIAKIKIFALLLLLAGGLNISFPLQESFAQTSSVSLAFDSQQLSIEADQTVSVPLVLNTQGQTIDGLQLSWEMSGVSVTSARLEVNPQLPFNALKNEVTATSGQVFLIPSDPMSPFSTAQPITVATLYLTPATNGVVTIKYDATNTLVASHETSSNILAPPADQQLNIEIDSSPTTETIGNTALQSGNPSAKNGISTYLPTAAVVVTGIVLIVACFWWWKKLKHSSSPAPVNTPAVTPPIQNNLNSVAQPQPNLYVPTAQAPAPNPADTQAPTTAPLIPTQNINTASIETPPKNTSGL